MGYLRLLSRCDQSLPPHCENSFDTVTLEAEHFKILERFTINLAHYRKDLFCKKNKSLEFPTNSYKVTRCLTGMEYNCVCE